MHGCPQGPSCQLDSTGGEKPTQFFPSTGCPHAFLPNCSSLPLDGFPSPQLFLSFLEMNQSKAVHYQSACNTFDLQLFASFPPSCPRLGSRPPGWPGLTSLHSPALPFNSASPDLLCSFGVQGREGEGLRGRKLGSDWVTTCPLRCGRCPDRDMASPGARGGCEDVCWVLHLHCPAQPSDWSSF